MLNAANLQTQKAGNLTLPAFTYNLLLKTYHLFQHPQLLTNFSKTGNGFI